MPSSSSMSPPDGGRRGVAQGGGGTLEEEVAAAVVGLSWALVLPTEATSDTNKKTTGSIFRLSIKMMLDVW